MTASTSHTTHRSSWVTMQNPSQSGTTSLPRPISYFSNQGGAYRSTTTYDNSNSQWPQDMNRHTKVSSSRACPTASSSTMSYHHYYSNQQLFGARHQYYQDDRDPSLFVNNTNMYDYAPPPHADELSSFSSTSHPNSLYESSSATSYNNNNPLKKLELTPPTPSREQHIPKRPRLFAAAAVAELNVVESLIHNIFSCGCVQGSNVNNPPNYSPMAVTTNGFASKPLEGSSGIGGGYHHRHRPRRGTGTRTIVALPEPPKLRRLTMNEMSTIDNPFMVE